MSAYVVAEIEVMDPVTYEEYRKVVPPTIAAYGGTNVCLRRIAAKNIYDAIETHGVTHFCGAPIVLNFIVNAAEDERKPLPHTVEVMTAGAAPPAAVIISTVRAARSTWRSTTTTEAPASANRRQAARPLPIPSPAAPPPVTIATRPPWASRSSTATRSARTAGCAGIPR